MAACKATPVSSTTDCCPYICLLAEDLRRGVAKAEALNGRDNLRAGCGAGSEEVATRGERLGVGASGGDEVDISLCGVLIARNGASTAPGTICEGSVCVKSVLTSTLTPNSEALLKS